MSRALQSVGIGATALALVGAFTYYPGIIPLLIGGTAAETEAHILALKPARELIVQRGDALVHGAASQPALFGADSEVHYLARATLRYTVDLRPAKVSYSDGKNVDVVNVHLPRLQVEASVDPKTKQKISSLTFFATEGGTGNDLERLADQDLQAEAEREALRPQNIETARRAALFEIKELYEQPLRAMGSTARVQVFFPEAT